METREAQRLADEAALDLVEVAPGADPPVVRIMDYGKYRYEQEQKAKLARKHQSQIHVKEIKLRPKISSNDYNTKKGHVIRFLKDRAKVKVTIMFRGREQTHPEHGEKLLIQLAEDVADLGLIESSPLQDGRNMTMVLAPLRNPGGPEDEPGTESGPAAEAASTALEAAPEAQAETDARSDPEADAGETAETKEAADA
jgi:translation initiation factor IF-3